MTQTLEIGLSESKITPEVHWSQECFDGKVREETEEKPSTNQSSFTLIFGELRYVWLSIDKKAMELLMPCEGDKVPLEPKHG